MVFAILRWSGLAAVSLWLLACAHPYPQQEQPPEHSPQRAGLAEPATPVIPKQQPVKIIAVGDIQLGRAWPPEQQRLPENATQVLSKVTPLLTGGDVVFGNLESVLADEGESAKCKTAG